MMTLTSAFGVSCALASSSGSRYVDGFGFRLACASGIVVTNRTVRIASSPRPPLPQRALARESPPRFPVPQRALERVPSRVPPLCLDIPLPFTRRRSAKPQLSASETGFTVGSARTLLITLWGEGRKIPPFSDGSRPGYPPAVRVRVPLTVGIAGARAAARLSRLIGAGGGTTVPGKVLSSIDPGVLDRLAQRLPLGSALISATNGKTTTAAMAAQILSPRVRLAHNSSGANLLSGVTSSLLSAKSPELGLFEVDEAALPEVAARVRPRAVCLGNLFRDQLDRYGELEHVAERWREAVRALPADAALVLNGDDPQVGDLAQDHPGAVVFGVDDPAVARPALQHAADSKYCVRCGTPYEYAAAYVGHLGDYRCPNCGHQRPPLEVAARDVSLHGLDAVAFRLDTPEGARDVRLHVPGLYNV